MLAATKHSSDAELKCRIAKQVLRINAKRNVWTMVRKGIIGEIKKSMNMCV